MPKKSEKNVSQKHKALLITLSIVVLLLITVGALLVVNVYKYSSLHDRVSIEGSKFNALDIGLSKSTDVTNCSYVSGVGLAGGGWICGTSWHNSIATENKTGIQKIVDIFSQSANFELKDKGDISSLYKVPKEQWYYGTNDLAPSFQVNAYDKKTHVSCILNFVNHDTSTVTIALSCEFGSHIPWYKIVSN